jgi:hypothetical protein
MEISHVKSERVDSWDYNPPCFRVWTDVSVLSKTPDASELSLVCFIISRSTCIAQMNCAPQSHKGRPG